MRCGLEKLARALDRMLVSTVKRASSVQSCRVLFSTMNTLMCTRTTRHRASHPNLKPPNSFTKAIATFSEHLRALLRLVQIERIDFIILDSLRCHGAMRAPSCDESLSRSPHAQPSPVLAHIPKRTAATEPFTPCFIELCTVPSWKEQEVGADEYVLGIFNRKSNLSRLHPPIGLRVRQNSVNTAMHYEAYDLSQTNELERGLPVASRIRNFLEKDGGVYTAKEIAEALGSPLVTVKSTLSRENTRKWHTLGTGRETKWTCVTR